MNPIHRLHQLNVRLEDSVERAAVTFATGEFRNMTKKATHVESAVRNGTPVLATLKSGKYNKIINPNWRKISEGRFGKGCLTS